MRLIGLTGFAQSGKDAAASFLVERGWKRLAFADKVREAALAIDPWVWVSVNELSDNDNHTLCMKMVGLRDEFIEEDGSFVRLSWIVNLIGWDAAKKLSDVRQYLQRIGTEAGRDIHGPECWTDIIEYQLWNCAERNVVITDVRFQEEVDLVGYYGGQIIRITKPGVGPVNNHKSDAAIDEIEHDMLLVNDGTLEDLRAKILWLADEKVAV